VISRKEKNKLMTYRDDWGGDFFFFKLTPLRSYKVFFFDFVRLLKDRHEGICFDNFSKLLKTPEILM